MVELHVGDIVKYSQYLGTHIIPHMSGLDEHVEHFDEQIYEVIGSGGRLLLSSKKHGIKELSQIDMSYIEII